MWSLRPALRLRPMGTPCPVLQAQRGRGHKLLLRTSDVPGSQSATTAPWGQQHHSPRTEATGMLPKSGALGGHAFRGAASPWRGSSGGRAQARDSLTPTSRSLRF